MAAMRDDLTDEELDRLDGVRKQIWRGGYAGFVVGGVWGLGNCALYSFIRTKAAQRFPNHATINAMPRLQNKHFVMWSLVAGAMGMFMGAGIEGARGRDSLQDIYDKRAIGAEAKQVCVYAKLRRVFILGMFCDGSL